MEKELYREEFCKSCRHFSPHWRGDRWCMKYNCSIRLLEKKTREECEEYEERLQQCENCTTCSFSEQFEASGFWYCHRNKMVPKKLWSNDIINKCECWLDREAQKILERSW